MDLVPFQNDNPDDGIATKSTPCWLEEPNPPPVPEPPSPAPNTGLGPMPSFWFAMRISNPIIAVLLIACVLAKLADLPFFEKFDAWVMCFYILVFAFIILSFECFGTMKKCAHILSKHFGFMYTINGRLLFMIMAGVIVCSLQSAFAFAVCGLTIANAIFNAVVMALHPNWTTQMMREHSALSASSRQL